MTRSRPSFTILLPVLTLAVAFAVLSALTTIRYVGFRRTSAHGRAVLIHNHVVNLRITPDQFFVVSLVAVATRASRPTQAINFPAMLTEAAVSGIMRTWPDSWRPHAFGPLPAGLFAWRGLIFPLYSLPFWWFAGFGLDAAFTRRHLRWPVLLAGTILFVLFAIVATGMALTTEHRDRDDMAFVFCGLALWTALWATFPFAWLRTFLERRRSKRTQASLQFNTNASE